jgi:hypothetical protein
MFGDKKKAVGMIVASLKAKSKPSESYVPKERNGDSEESEDESGSALDEGLLAASEDILAAIKNEDSKALAEALKDFIEMC